MYNYIRKKMIDMSTKDLNSYDVEKILERHNKFFYTQATKNVEFRIRALRRLKSTIERYENEVLEALYLDLRKNKVESYTTEVGFVYNSIEEAIKNLKNWVKPTKVKTPIFLMPAKSFIINEPYGTVLIIGPYNYPFQLIVEPLVGVIAAGNCAVIKPSELAPNVSKIILKIIGEAFDESYICAVEGAIDTNTALINSKFDYIFFTGSPAVGRIVMEAAAKNLVPVTLELGGKSPVIVDKSAKVKGARHIVTGVCETDFSGYPDCRDIFIKSLNVTTNLAMDYNFVIHTPLMWIDKAATWKMADKYGKLDYVRNNTLTCYNGIIGDGCGECPACILRKRGLEAYLNNKS